MNDDRVFLVTGGTGKTGAALVRRLAQGVPEAEIRVGTRSPDSLAAGQMAAIGPNVRPVGMNGTDGMAEALVGVTHVYALPAFDPAGMDAWHEALAAAITASGTVRHVVKHSVQGARRPSPGDTPSAIPRMHGDGEAILRATGVPFTALRPTIFAQHVTDMPWVFESGGDALYLPTGDAGIAFIDASEIAATAAAILTCDDPTAHDGEAYALTGPTAVTGADMARAIGAASGRDVRHEDLTHSEFEDRIARHGGPPGLAIVYSEAAEGHFATVTDAVARITGRPGKTFAQFAYDNRHRF
ncbi:MAG: NmrA family NAD(P)-binding protein [Alphaproteobacteria bacterium]|nr:NmrA family NAD(P)-binding protein [Alphaproteobacteria bacterium]